MILALTFCCFSNKFPTKFLESAPFEKLKRGSPAEFKSISNKGIFSVYPPGIEILLKPTKY